MKRVHTERSMANFDIFVNGKQICTMSGEETGQLQAVIEWFRGPVVGSWLPAGTTRTVEGMSLGMLKIDSAGYPSDLPRMSLNVGDEITVRIRGASP